MSRAPSPPTARRAVVAFTVTALLGVAGLILAGAHDQRSTAFSLGVPSLRPVLALHSGQTACQSPIAARTAFAGVEIWTEGAGPPGTAVEVSARDATNGEILGSAQTVIENAVPAPDSARLRTTVAFGARVAICVLNRGRLPVIFLGSTADPSSGSLTGGGTTSGSALSMVLLRPRASSLLSSLGTSFDRAALFRPDWMGAWTFWLLLGLVVTAFGLTAVTVSSAARADDDPTGRDR